MKNEFRLALFTSIFELELKLAKEYVDERFRAPLKEFLLNQNAKDRRDGFEVGGIVKAFIQEDRPKDELDVQKVQDDFASAVAAGKIGYAELKDLVAKGFIGTTNFAKVALELTNRKLGSGYTTRVPGGGRPALKILTLDKGQLEGVQQAMRKDIDIKELIHNSSGITALQQAEKILAAGKVALQRP